MLDAVVSDTRHALRRMGRSPGTAALAAVSLALAFAPNVALFSVMDYLFLTPLRVQAPSELLQILFRDSRPDASPAYDLVSYPEFLDFRRALESFSGLAYARRQGATLTLEGRRLLIFINLVSDNYFDLLGVPIRSGPGFAQTGSPVVISHRLWLRELGGAADIVGRPLLVTGQAFTIAGIAPPEFRGTEYIISVDLWIPMEAWLRLQPQFRTFLERRDHRDGLVWARRRPGVTLDAARAEVERAAAQLAETWPATNRYLLGHTYDAFRDRQRGGLTLTTLGVLLAGLLLAVACANVAGLLLAQAEERRQELAIRQALGASRLRLIRQWITESFLIGFAGAALGLLGARLLLAVLPALQPALVIPLHFEFALGTRVWLYALALLVVSALGFGLVPAWRASRLDLLAGLRRDSTVSLLHLRVPVRSLLIVGQVAAAELLLFGAGLLLDHLARARKIDPGFDPNRPVILATILATAEDGVPRELDYSALAARLEQIPGVRRAAYGRSVPLSGSRGPSLQVELPGQQSREVLGGAAGPGFFSTLGLRIALGRDFLASDRHGVLVNSTLARLLDPTGNPVGRMLRVEGRPLQVIGVVQDAAWSYLREPPQPRLLGYAPPRGAEMTLAIQVAGAPQAYLPEIRKQLAAAAPGALVASLSTLRQHYETSLFLERTATQVLYVLGVLALVLTVAGLHGIAAAVFARRSREFGLRLALGATPRHLLGLVLRHTLLLTAAGFVLGLLVAVPLALLAASKQPGLSPWSWRALGLSSVIVTLAALAAAAYPARRALRLQPADVLRSE